MKICVDLKCSNCGYVGMRLIEPETEFRFRGISPCSKCGGKLEIIASEEIK